MSTNSIISAIDMINAEVQSLNSEIAGHAAAIEAANAAVQAAEARIEQLVAARDTIGALVTVEEAKPVRAAQRKRATEKVAAELESVDVDAAVAAAEATEGTRPRRRRKMTSSEAGEALVESVAKQSRRTRRAAKEATPTKQSAAAKRAARPKTLADLREKEQVKRGTVKASTNGHKPNRKEQITKLLRAGKSPREVAEHLGIAPNYVYHVKRGL